MSTKEAMKKAKATIPEPIMLERRVRAVLRHVLAKDYDADMAILRGDTTKRRTFKPLNSAVSQGSRKTKVFQLIKNQHEHVTKGCLSDPPKEVIRIIWINLKTNDAFTGRSTGTCEASHREVNAVLDTPSVGVVDWTFNSESYID